MDYIFGLCLSVKFASKERKANYSISGILFFSAGGGEMSKMDRKSTRRAFLVESFPICDLCHSDIHPFSFSLSLHPPTMSRISYDCPPFFSFFALKKLLFAIWLKQHGRHHWQTWHIGLEGKSIFGLEKLLQLPDTCKTYWIFNLKFQKIQVFLKFKHLWNLCFLGTVRCSIPHPAQRPIPSHFITMLHASLTCYFAAK